MRGSVLGKVAGIGTRGVVLLLGCGVGVSDLRTLDVDDAAVILEAILDVRSEQHDSLRTLLHSKKGSGIQSVIDVASLVRM